jgi:hypothetical protein
MRVTGLQNMKKDHDIDIYHLLDLYTDEELLGPDKEKPSYPPMPQKFHEKLWSEFTPEEQSAYRVEHRKRKLGWLHTGTNKVLTFEWRDWDHQCAAIRREFFDIPASMARQEKARWSALTPEERAFEVERKAWEKAQKEWLDGLDWDDYLAAIKGKISFPGWERYALVDDEVLKASQKAERDEHQARREVALSLYRTARLTGKPVPLFAVGFQTGEDLLGHIPETVEEYEAIADFVDHVEKGQWFVENKMDDPSNGAWVTHGMALEKLKEKLQNLRDGWTERALKQRRDRKHNAKRKEDPEFKAKRAAYMRERRARLKAGSSVA